MTATCKGSFALGTACGKCQSCQHEMGEVLAHIDSSLLAGKKIDGRFPDRYVLVGFPEMQVEYIKQNNIATVSGHGLEFKVIPRETT